MNKDAYLKVSTLSKIIFENLGNVSFQAPTLFIPNTDDIKKRLDEAVIQYVTLNGEISIDISEFEIIVFYDQTDFFTRIELVDIEDDIEDDFAILVVNYDFNDFQYYDAEKDLVFTSGDTEPDNHFLCENTVYYLKFLEALRAKIADYDNTPITELIIFDTKRSVRELKYTDIPPLWDSSKRIRRDCSLELLFEKFSSIEFQSFFKNELAAFIKNVPEDGMMKKLIDKLPRLIRNVDINLRLYLNQFSFEKLKNEIQREKIKYLKSLRDILGKFISQVIAIPLSISATAFATYQIKNSFILTLALIAFLIYSLYVMHIQLIYLRDVREIEEDIEDEFDNIKKSSGLQNQEFEKEEAKLEHKIKITKITIKTFIAAIISLTILFLVFIALQRLIDLEIIIISTFAYICLIMIRMYIDRNIVNVADEKVSP
jgi:hypothetical protein